MTDEQKALLERINKEGPLFLFNTAALVKTAALHHISKDDPADNHFLHELINRVGIDVAHEAITLALKNNANKKKMVSDDIVTLVTTAPAPPAPIITITKDEEAPVREERLSAEEILRSIRAKHNYTPEPSEFEKVKKAFADLPYEDDKPEGERPLIMVETAYSQEELDLFFKGSIDNVIKREQQTVENLREIFGRHSQLIVDIANSLGWDRSNLPDEEGRTKLYWIEYVEAAEEFLNNHFKKAS